MGLAVPRAASVSFGDGFRIQDRPPGTGRGGAPRRSYREAQGEAAVPPLAAAARKVAPYAVPVGAVLMLSFGMAFVSSLCTKLFAVTTCDAPPQVSY